MSQRWGDSQHDRNALDDYITNAEKWGWSGGDEYDPPCPKCGRPMDDHVPIQLTNADGNDYETYRCPELHCGELAVHDPHGNCPGKTFPGQEPQPATGSTMARDNDPAFRPI